MYSEADIHPGTVCHRLSCRKRPIISSHGSSGGVKCVIYVASNWQPALVEVDWCEGRAAVTQTPNALMRSPLSLLPLQMLYIVPFEAFESHILSALMENLQIYKEFGCRCIFRAASKVTSPL